MWPGHLLGLWPWEFIQPLKALIASLEKGEIRTVVRINICEAPNSAVTKCFFLKIVLLRYNSHTKNFTHLKCTIQ